MTAGSDDYTSVNFHGMQQAQADFELIYRGVADELGDLDKDLKKLLGDWIGNANNEYGQTMLKWQRAVDDMANTLNALGITIRDVHSNYSEAELANARLWQGA
ncbi:WXG100 family type VII secretion target [Actinoallomurus sp. NBC_01490]|jgi:WXG100 family type VII secretion target|uniref:WXG100 family type VII secretion target n=1 Tax=Actinoallomurus sp. NBC_01490 TaxID=2903557 RepID=UPI002E34762F|nr:WXG100 family type VII secretion target [Actinoallomurus sp. NBC_01490]